MVQFGPNKLGLAYVQHNNSHLTFAQNLFWRTPFNGMTQMSFPTFCSNVRWIHAHVMLLRNVHVVDRVKVLFLDITITKDQ